MKEITRETAIEMIGKGKVLQAERKALGHDVRDNVQIGKEMLVLVFPHKLVRLPELDLDNLGQRPVMGALSPVDGPGCAGTCTC